MENPLRTGIWGAATSQRVGTVGEGQVLRLHRPDQARAKDLSRGFFIYLTVVVSPPCHGDAGKR